MTLSWHAINRPHPHETVSGDGFVVVELAESALIVGVDGLGHGEKAHQAATSAVQTVNANQTASPLALFDYLHRELRQTRGAVVTIASIDFSANAITWGGIGNVKASVHRAAHAEKPREQLFLRGGVVGFQMPKVKLFQVAFTPGDTLLMVTDGIRSNYMEDLPLTQSPAAIATHVIATHARDTDDATAIVARYAVSSP